MVNGSSSVVEFISYVGSFNATAGPANELTSTQIGVQETTTTPVGFSLQLTGTGCMRSAYSWAAPAANTKGFANNGQVCIPTSPPTKAPTKSPTKHPT